MNNYKCQHCGQPATLIHSLPGSTMIECDVHGFQRLTSETTPDGYTIREMHQCAAREYKMRQSVYPRVVQQGRMTQEQADKEIGMMRAIALHLERQVPAEGVQASIFGGS